jgi:hypothetical protein
MACILRNGNKASRTEARARAGTQERTVDTIDYVKLADLATAMVEHSVVNMFIIPTGMMMGAKVTVSDWWLWNQIPVTFGNMVGGFLFTGFAIYTTYKPRAAAKVLAAAPSGVPAE